MVGISEQDWEGLAVSSPSRSIGLAPRELDGQPRRAQAAPLGGWPRPIHVSSDGVACLPPALLYVVPGVGTCPFAVSVAPERSIFSDHCGPWPAAGPGVFQRSLVPVLLSVPAALRVAVVEGGHRRWCAQASSDLTLLQDSGDVVCVPRKVCFTSATKSCCPARPCVRTPVGPRRRSDSGRRHLGSASLGGNWTEH